MTDKKDIFYYARFYGIPIYFQPEENEIVGINWFWNILLTIIEPFIVSQQFKIKIYNKTITRQEIKEKLGD